jgi:hypothetical protein
MRHPRPKAEANVVVVVLPSLSEKVWALNRGSRLRPGTRIRTNSLKCRTASIPGGWVSGGASDQPPLEASLAGRRTATACRVTAYRQLHFWDRNPELDEQSEVRIVDPRFWRMVNEDLPKIADAQCREFFRRFVKLVWYEGRTRRAAWEELTPDCRGFSTFCKWQKKLALAVMKRWAKGEPEAGGGV